MVNAIAKVEPKDGDKMPNVWFNALDVSAYNPNAPYPDINRQEFTDENCVSDKTATNRANATASTFRACKCRCQVVKSNERVCKQTEVILKREPIHNDEK